jgi:hypothetical protein
MRSLEPVIRRCAALTDIVSLPAELLDPDRPVAARRHDTPDHRRGDIPVTLMPCVMRSTRVAATGPTLPDGWTSTRAICTSSLASPASNNDDGLSTDAQRRCAHTPAAPSTEGR